MTADAAVAAVATGEMTIQSGPATTTVDTQGVAEQTEGVVASAEKEAKWAEAARARREAAAARRIAAEVAELAKMPMTARLVVLAVHVFRCLSLGTLALAGMGVAVGVLLLAWLLARACFDRWWRLCCGSEQHLPKHRRILTVL